MRALIVCPNKYANDRDKINSNSSRAKEFINLSQAIDSITVASVFHLNVVKVIAGTFFGKGKIAEFKIEIENFHVELLLVDTNLSPMQQRNLEKLLFVKVLDRTGLILEIFGNRAQTREGVLQVDLAHLEYQKTRLVRSWTHLERQRGGIGFMGGPGEKQIESDRRSINEKIFRIKKLLDKVIKMRRLHRTRRKKQNIPVVALVGYTNSGKSSIFNHITQSKVVAKNMLFATLDPKLSVFKLLGLDRIILLDTVGFISDLPTDLISAFKATLEEVVNSNLILHVRDISHENTKQQALDVHDTLERLEWGDRIRPPIIEVYNKIDNLIESDFTNIKSQCANSQNIVLMSATEKKGFDYLFRQIKKVLSAGKAFEEVFISFSDARRRAWLFEKQIVIFEKIVKDGFLIKVHWSNDQKIQFLDCA